MARISNKLLKQIDAVSVYDDVLRKYGQAWWLDNRPEEWERENKELFDITVEIETRLKRDILRLLGKEEEQ